jgi:hypothetical protein
MKNLFLVFFTMFSICIGSNAQQVITSSTGAGNPRLGMFDNEVKLNFANLLALGSFEAGYERFLSDGHSIDFQVHINDRFGYNAEGNGRKFKTNALQAGMNFYFGNGLNGRFHIYPFVKFRFGDFEEVVNRAIITTDMTAFIIGAGAGYKWEVSDHFAFGPYVSFGRGFSESVSDRFTALELNGGFSLGYRF